MADAGEKPFDIDDPFDLQCEHYRKAVIGLFPPDRVGSADEVTAFLAGGLTAIAGVMLIHTGPEKHPEVIRALREAFDFCIKQAERILADTEGRLH